VLHGRLVTVDTLVVGTSRRLARGLLASAAVLAVVTVLSDPAGRLLTAPAALVALVLGIRDLRAGPVLVADGDGVSVNTGWRHVHAAWSEIERMRVVRDRRAELLELDLGRTVVLLSRTRMDRLPPEVLTDLLAVRAAAVDPGLSR
jgi:hypothetical protein